MFGLLASGIKFVKNYSEFKKDNGASKTHIRRLTNRLDEDVENAQKLLAAIGKLKSHYGFSDELLDQAVCELSYISGDLLRIKDTVAAEGYSLFNGVNKNKLVDDLNRLKGVQSDISEVVPLYELE